MSRWRRRAWLATRPPPTPSAELGRVAARLRQTLQAIGELPREHGWQVIEDLTRRLGSVGPKRPVMIALAPNALKADVDRLEALACVGLTLRAMNDPQAASVAQEVLDMASSGPNSAVSPRLIALLLAAGQGDVARKLMPEPAAGVPELAARLAYADGLARAGDMDKAVKIAMLPGPEDQRVAALAMVADANPAGLEPAARFAAECGQKFTLPNWALIRIVAACERGRRPDLARQLATDVAQKDVKPWLELSALRAELADASSPADAPDLSGDQTPAEAIAAVVVGRHNARISVANPRTVVEAWTIEAIRPPGLAGSGAGPARPPAVSRRLLGGPNTSCRTTAAINDFGLCNNANTGWSWSGPRWIDEGAAIVTFAGAATGFIGEITATGMATAGAGRTAGAGARHRWRSHRFR